MIFFKYLQNVVLHLQGYKTEEEIDFVAFSYMWCDNHQYKKGRKNYIAAVKALCRFFGKEQIMVSEITAKSMRLFEKSLDDRPRAQTLYTSSITRLFNEAVEHFNDESNGIVVIKHSLEKYKPPRQKAAKKRGLPVETIRAIFALPYDNLQAHGYPSRHDLAKDCFMLSFCLLGMNSADLYNAEEIKGKRIVYCRTKTKDRRFDRAEMQVEVPEIVMHLLKKYKGKNRIFNFSERYRSMQDFNRAINLGLKEVGKEVGVSKLQFYAARHSMASIAVNKVGIDKFTVNDMLNHTDQSMRVTDLYIEKDFTRINLANDRLIRYMFTHPAEEQTNGESQ